MNDNEATYIDCTINNEVFEIAESPITFGPALCVEPCDNIQFGQGLEPSDNNCVVLFNSYVVVGQCIYHYRKSIS